MFALVLVLAPAPVPVLPEDLLAANRFGVASGCAIQNARLAHDHPPTIADEVQAWNPSDVFIGWQKETAWRYDCWNCLAAALDGQMVMSRYDYLSSEATSESVYVDDHLSDYSRRFHLARLRQLLGDDAFDAGLMPDPLPHYRR